jgi:hypothetical protein
MRMKKKTFRVFKYVSKHSMAIVPAFEEFGCQQRDIVGPLGMYVLQ